MQINVKFFGMLADVVGQAQLNVNIDLPVTIGSLQEYLYRNYPELKGKTYKSAVNQKLVNNSYSIQSTDEIALLPPFAGG